MSSVCDGPIKGSQGCYSCAPVLVTEFKASETVEDCSCDKGRYLNCAPNTTHCNRWWQLVVTWGTAAETFV